MICLKAQYFNLNKILLQCTALWPFQQSKLVRLQFSIILTVLVTAIICQITTFVTSKFTPKFAVKVFSCVIFLTVLVVHYGSFRSNIKILKDLMRQLHFACTKLRDKNEIAIIQQYGWEAKHYTVALIVVFFTLESIFWASQIAIFFLDNVMSTNGSQSHRLQIAVEYFIDQQKYYYLILLHINAAIFVGVLTFLAMGTLMIVYLQHTCGMFRIACYRIEHAMKINIFRKIDLNSETLIFRKIVYAVNIHREAMRLTELLVSSFDKTYFCLTVLTVIALTFNLFQIFQSLTSESNIIEAIIPTGTVLVLVLYMFFANFFGQHITDHNNEVYDVAYNMKWYMCPLHIQKLIILLLQRKAKEFQLTCGGLFVASFECFASLTKATMSYFTLLHSTR
ncbi:hypothetical protein HN011_007303 [Eciton burchellii]|nr:hypothetical protein HN011_007303 [Eciton burchellii]